MRSRSNLRTASTLISRHRRLAASALAASLVVAVETAIRPMLTTRLVHNALVAHHSAAAWQTAAVILAALAASVVAGHLGQLRFARLSEAVLRDLRLAVFDRELHGADRRPGALSAVVNDANLAAQQLASVVPLAGGAAFNVVAAAVAMLLVDARVLAVVGAVVAAVFVPASLRFRTGAVRTTNEYLHRYDDMSAALSESARGARVAWRFGRHDLSHRFDEPNAANATGYIAVFRLSALYTSSLLALRGVTYGVTVVATAALVPAQSRVPVLAGFLVALPALFGAVELLAQLLDSFTIGVTALSRLTSLDLGATGIAEHRGRDDRFVANGDPTVVVEAASRSFPTFELGPLTVDLGPGLIAVVGASGAGKTTFARLIAGLDTPTSGTIRRAGSTAANAREDGRVVMLPQEPSLFPGSLADMLRLTGDAVGVDEATLESDVRELGLGDWIDRLPDGLDTDTGEHLSEGDRRIVAMLLVLRRDPAVVVLDEPTAGLDAVSASRIERLATQMFRGRCIILITHRLATARSADRVLVFDEGRVVGDGDDSQLTASCPAYRALTLPGSQLPPTGPGP